MRILFVMDQRADRGSIQCISNYVRAGDEGGVLHCTLRPD